MGIDLLYWRYQNRMRKSPIAGTWYPGVKEELMQLISSLFINSKFGPGRIPDKLETNTNKVTAIVPHAGLRYSGYTAAHAFLNVAESMNNPDTVIILGPNHRGIGADFATSEENWETPFGILEIDKEILEYTEGTIINVDESAHTQEHSIEIQLPFLQYIYGNEINIFPICIKDQHRYEELTELLREILRNFENKNIIILASSDLSHEYNYDTLMNHDQKMIDLIVSGDFREAAKFRKEVKMTMCGYGPVFTLMGISTFKFLGYSNSSMIMANFEENSYRVGYSAFINN